MANTMVDPLDTQGLIAASVEKNGSTRYDLYDSPLKDRYASIKMLRLFSKQNRHSTWRKLWLFLAEAEKELGIESITQDALNQMKEHLLVTPEDFDIAQVEEAKRRHDVMAHVHAFGQVAPAAAGIIHYGATSCYVTDNTELLLMREGLDILSRKLAKVISNLSAFAQKWKSQPTLAYTHLRPAQLITVGKRATQWAQDFLFDLEALERVRRELRFRGAQGTTGTQASFLEIFNGDSGKCDQLNKLLCEKTGFPSCYVVSSQTYSRKVDLIIANAVCGIGSSANKMASDIRMLASVMEMEEPFEKDQIGSSAMAYKRNPMLSERICGMSRDLMGKPALFANTHASQGFERTLDDSAIRRMDIPEMFLLADAILLTLDNVTSGLVVYPKRIDARVQDELPFMITETIIMRLVAKGESRQEAHEQVRVLSQQASAQIKKEGKPNDLIARIRATDYFQPIWDELDEMLVAKLYIGRCEKIVDKFCAELEEHLAKYKEFIEKAEVSELSV